MIYSEELIEPWLHPLRAEVPDLDLVDVHIHVGLADPAALLATEEEAVGSLELAGADGVVYPLKEPDGYTEPNRRAREFARRSDGRIRTFARLDPADDPLGEAKRGLDDGAAGIKLHPRGEGFDLVDPRLDDVFALADAERLPIMVHAGQGVPEMADHAHRRSKDHPNARIILAHCGAGAFDAIWPRIDEYPNLLFDTSWWNPSTIAALLRLVPPRHILFASDIPFASVAQQMVQTMRVALQVGLAPDQIRAIMGGQARRVLAREELLDPGPTPAPGEPISPGMERMYAGLMAVSERMLGGQDPGQEFAFAVDACTVGADGPKGEVLRAIGRLLEQVQEREDPDPLRAQRTPGFDLALIAATVARTPDVALPADF
jgi:hypothetical protein